MEFTLVDSSTSIATLIDSIVNLPSIPPSLYVKLEGIDLSRQGHISILQLNSYPQKHVYLIDIHVLGGVAFKTPGTGGETLQSILESPIIPKVFFEVGNDSNALFFHYGIALQGVEDIQLMECASRASTGPLPKDFARGLLECIESDDAPIDLDEKMTWKAANDADTTLFAPEQGGPFAFYNGRPLKRDIKEYFVRNVQFLPILRQTYCNRLQPDLRAKVDAETMDRVQLSQTTDYLPNRSDKGFSPWWDFRP